MSISRRLRSWLIAVLIILLVPIHSSFALQEADVDSSPTWTPAGLHAAGIRTFVASGMRLVGSTTIISGVFVFGSDGLAEIAFPGAVDYTHEYLNLDPETLREASAPPNLGDESVAHVGTWRDPANPEQPYSAATVLWRDGRFVFVGIAFGVSGDVLSDLFAIGRAISGREFGEYPISTPTSSQEMHSGGVWDLLPTLKDVPEGFVFEKDDPVK